MQRSTASVVVAALHTLRSYLPAAARAIMATMTSSFLGQSLKAGAAPLQPAQAPRAAPVQAFFKKAEKTAKKAAAPAKGNATQVSSGPADHALLQAACWTSNSVQLFTLPGLRCCADRARTDLLCIQFPSTSSPRKHPVWCTAMRCINLHVWSCDPGGQEGAAGRQEPVQQGQEGGAKAGEGCECTAHAGTRALVHVLILTASAQHALRIKLDLAPGMQPVSLLLMHHARSRSSGLPPSPRLSLCRRQPSR